LDRVFRLDLTDVLHPSVGRGLVLPDLAPAIWPLDEGIHVAREVKLWQEDWHFFLELKEFSSLKGILARLVQHFGYCVSSLKDAVEVVGEWIAWLYLLGSIPLLPDAGTEQRATPTGDGWSPNLRLAGKVPVKDGGEVAHSNPSL